MVTHTFQDMGSLVNLYVDILERKIDFESEGQRLVQACLVLTVLHMIRRCLHGAAQEDGSDLRDTSRVIIPRLQQDLVTATGLMTPTEIVYYQEAFFWMSYAGAVYEQQLMLRDRRRPPTGDPIAAEEQWFVKMVATLAAEMHLTTWADAKAVLEKFVYYRYLEPDGILWFEDL